MNDIGLIAHYPLSRQWEAPVLSNLVTNGNFANWTNDDPDDWTVTEVGDATSKVTQNPAGQCQIISDGTLARVVQSGVLTVGRRYVMEVEITVSTSGTIKFGEESAATKGGVSGVGIHKHTFTASVTGIVISRDTACNITVDNIIVYELQTTDASGNGNNGILYPGSGDYTKDQFGRAGKAYEFDALATKIDCQSDFIPTTDTSVMVWVYYAGLGEGSNGQILTNGTFAFFITDAQRFRLNGSSNATYSPADEPLQFDRWYLLTASMTTGGIATLYINNRLVTIRTNAGFPNAGTGNVIIGNRADGDRTFDGKIGNTWVYNRIVSLTEVENEWKRYQMLRNHLRAA